MTEYVVTCNPTKFDLVKHFKTSKRIVWKACRGCMIGDVVFVYVGRPYSRLLYMCTVVNNNILLSKEAQGYYANQAEGNHHFTYMELELVKQLPDNGFELDILLSHGLKTVQCATKVSEELHAYIAKNIQ